MFFCHVNVIFCHFVVYLHGTKYFNMLLREETHTHVRYSHKPSRNEKLFRYYIETLKSYGDKATAFSKEYLYAQCADVFDICAVTAGRIIRSMVSDGKYTKFLSEDECNEYPGVLVKYGRRESANSI